MATEVATQPEPEVDPNVAPAAEAKTEKKVKPEVKVDPGLSKIIANYDESVEKAVSHQVEMIDYIRKNNISRAVLVKTLVEVRKIEVVSATSEASRIMKLAKDDQIFEQLKNGEITLKAARNATKKPQAKKEVPQEPKEKIYEKALIAFAEAAKAVGLPLKDILESVKATLKADPYNIK